MKLQGIAIAAIGAVVIGATLSGAQTFPTGDVVTATAPATVVPTNYAGCPLTIVHANVVLKLASSITDDDKADELVGCMYDLAGGGNEGK